MARNPASFAKRQRELARARKRKERVARRADRKKRKATHDVADGEDPDIAGIVPGPQALPWDENGYTNDNMLSPDEPSDT